jgi:hypothetical protein
MKTEIPPFDLEIRDQLIPHCINIVAIYGPLKVKQDHYTIKFNTQLPIDNCLNKNIARPAIPVPFAENNFGPFEHIVFVIVLFESLSKTLFRVLFASLYLLQIYIFYHGISISCPTVSSK